MEEASINKRSPVTSASKKIGFNTIYLFLKFSIKLIIVLGSIGLCYFLWQQKNIIYDLQFSQQQIAVVNIDILDQFQALQQGFENINNNKKSSEILFNQQKIRLDNLNAELASLRLGMNANQSVEVWEIVEAASLLRIAKQYLDLSQHIPIALSLYQSSNAILAQIDNPALNRIQSLLVSDIQTLRNTRSIDTESLYMRLSDLSRQLNNINLAANIEPSAIFDNQNSDDDNVGIFKRFSSSFERYFAVRRLDAPIIKPLNNQQIFILRLNMQLQIEQAKLALLQRSQSVYLDSINNLILLAQTNISDRDQHKIFVLEVLKGLQSESIFVDITSLSESLRLLENLMSVNSVRERN